MSWISKALTSSLGRKLAMSLTGLFLVSFLLVHMGGNVQLFYNDGGDAFNTYSKFMSTSPIIRVLEIVLLAGFVTHIWTSVILTRRNANARPVSYAYTQPSPGVTWFSKNMGLSGSIVLVFLIIHLLNFWFPYHYGSMPTKTDAHGEQIKDMYALVEKVFRQEWWYSILYVLACVLLGFHLNHGFFSAFRTLGVEHKKYTPLMKAVSQFISVVIPAGFAAMPLYFLLK
ncbi:MAG: succinate dehydrogenase cytochrome b subunit [Bacteroidota bacterium]